jgi:5-methylcytosine-specific restriction endonuclease McrA
MTTPTITSRRITHSNRGSKWITPALRNAIYSRDGFTCVYCGKCRSTDGGTLSLDHVLAASEGGTDSASNLVTVCGTCNSRKGAKPLGVFARSLSTSERSVTNEIKRRTARKVNLDAGKEIVRFERDAVNYFVNKFNFAK